MSGNENILFSHGRKMMCGLKVCPILEIFSLSTQIGGCCMQDPHLVLTGPARAPVTLFGPMHFDITLKVKCSNELEDKDLSLLGFR